MKHKENGAWTGKYFISVLFALMLGYFSEGEYQPAFQFVMCWYIVIASILILIDVVVSETLKINSLTGEDLRPVFYCIIQIVFSVLGFFFVVIKLAIGPEIKYIDAIDVLIIISYLGLVLVAFANFIGSFFERD